MWTVNWLDQLLGGLNSIVWKQTQHTARAFGLAVPSWSPVPAAVPAPVPVAAVTALLGAAPALLLRLHRRIVLLSRVA